MDSAEEVASAGVLVATVSVSMEDGEKSEQPGPSHCSASVESSGRVEDSQSSQGTGDVPMSTLNLYAALGLSPEDVDALAQIPESEISVETLPHLIMQLKAKRAEKGRQPQQSPPEDQDVWEEDGHDSGQPGPSCRSPAHTRTADCDGHERSARMWGRRDWRYTRASHERSHVGSPLRFPQSYQKDDFHGALPRSFPHTCSLCYCILNSSTTWNDHLNGSRHKDGRRDLLHLYPDWDPNDVPRRISDLYRWEEDVSPSRRATRVSVPLRRPFSSDRITGDRLPPPADRRPLRKPKAGTKVVVTKFPLGSVAVEDLLNLAKPFGTVVKHLVFPCKGFLEFSAHKEAASMVDHYASKPAFVKANKLILYLSPMVESIHTPRTDDAEKRTKPLGCAVVSFSHLPPGKETESELLDLAKMFGEVRHSKVSNNEAFIEMSDWKDADIMVKYYQSNPLRMNGRHVKVILTSTYKRLRPSPEPAKPRRGEPVRGCFSRNKGHSKSNEKVSMPKESTEIVGQKQRATPEGEQEDHVTKDELAMKVEDEQVLLEDELHHHDERTLLGSSVKTRPSEEEEGLGHSDMVAECTPPGSLETPDVPPASGEVVSMGSPDITGEELERERFHEDEEDVDFPENMDDFVTLDELDNDAGVDTGSLDSSDSTQGGGKVVVVRHIRKGYGLEESLLKLAEPFGKVINHEISVYKQEAFMEMDSPQAANKMVTFYRGNRKAKILGKPVSVSMCFTLQKLEAPSGKSIYIGMLPLQKYSDVSLLRLAQPFGKVSAYHLNWRNRKCYIQMESVRAAQKMLEQYLQRPPKFHGSVLRVSLCRKGDSLIPWKAPVKYELWCAQQKSKKVDKDDPGESGAENGQSTQSAALPRGLTEEDGRSCVSDSDGVCGVPVSDVAGGVPVSDVAGGVPVSDVAGGVPVSDVAGGVPVSDVAGGVPVSDVAGGVPVSDVAGEAVSLVEERGGQEVEQEVEQKAEATPVSLGPHQPNNPVGIDYVVQRTGFFCKLCNVFYTNERTAKWVHCSSLAHYQKLKNKLEGGEGHTDE